MLPSGTPPGEAATLAQETVGETGSVEPSIGQDLSDDNEYAAPGAVGEGDSSDDSDPGDL